MRMRSCLLLQATMSVRRSSRVMNVVNPSSLIIIKSSSSSGTTTTSKKERGRSRVDSATTAIDEKDDIIECACVLSCCYCY